MRALTAGAILTVLSGPIAIAQTQTPPAPLALTLDEAVARGLTASPTVAEAGARADAAGASVRSQSALRLPTVSTTDSYVRTNHVTAFSITQPGAPSRVIFPDIPDNYRLHAEVTEPLFTSGRVGALVEAASAEERAALDDRRTASDNVRLEVTRAYWALVTARETVHVLEQAQARTDAYVGDVRARIDAGLAPPNDLLSAQAQRARQAVQLIQARNAAAEGELDLARLVGAPLGQPIQTVTAVDQPTAGVTDLTSQPIDALVARARGERADREAIRERQQSLQQSGVAAVAATRPQIGLLASVEPARPNQLFVPRSDQWKTSWNLGVNLSVTLWDGGRAKANQAAAQANAAALGHRLDDFDARLAVEIRSRILDLAAARASVTAAADEVNAATEARRVVEERFRAGVATSTDVLDAQVVLLQAELEATQLAAALRVDEAVFLRAVGGH